MDLFPMDRAVRSPHGWEAFVEWHTQRGKAPATTQKHLSNVRLLLTRTLGVPKGAVAELQSLLPYILQFEAVRAAVLALPLSLSSKRSYAMSISLAATWPALRLPYTLVKQYREFWQSL